MLNYILCFLLLFGLFKTLLLAGILFVSVANEIGIQAQKSKDKREWVTFKEGMYKNGIWVENTVDK